MTVQKMSRTPGKPSREDYPAGRKVTARHETPENSPTQHDHPLQQLQRSVGNRAVGQALHSNTSRVDKAGITPQTVIQRQDGDESLLDSASNWFSENLMPAIATSGLGKPLMGNLPDMGELGEMGGRPGLRLV